MRGLGVLVAILLWMTVGLAACGGDDDESTGTEPEDVVNQWVAAYAERDYATVCDLTTTGSLDPIQQEAGSLDAQAALDTGTPGRPNDTTCEEDAEFLYDQTVDSFGDEFDLPSDLEDTSEVTADDVTVDGTEAEVDSADGDWTLTSKDGSWKVEQTPLVGLLR